MADYRVRVRVPDYREYSVAAVSAKHAINKVKDGKGNYYGRTEWATKPLNKEWISEEDAITYEAEEWK